MKKLVSKAGSALIRRRIEDASALTSEVYASLVDYLDTNGALRVPPFDTTACHGAGLPELQFEQRSGSFVITLWRDWLTAEVLAELDLNNRQVQAVEYVKSHERITNAEYQRVTGSPQRTATRDLNELVQKGVLELEGKGRGAQYRLLQKRAIRGDMRISNLLTVMRHKYAKCATNRLIKRG